MSAHSWRAFECLLRALQDHGLETFGVQLDQIDWWTASHLGIERVDLAGADVIRSAVRHQARRNVVPAAEGPG